MHEKEKRIFCLSRTHNKQASISALWVVSFSFVPEGVGAFLRRLYVETLTHNIASYIHEKNEYKQEKKPINEILRSHV